MSPNSKILSDELLKKVRRIEITTRKIVNDVMTGQYRSHFKGAGVQFSEHRLYLAGDDVRHIDWKVSARSKEPMVKLFEEERELNVLLLVDVSGSENFGSHLRTKLEMAAEIGGMLAYAATQTGDRVGVLLFAGKVEKIIPLRKGRQHVLRIVRELVGYQPETKGSNLATALESASRILKHSGVVFIISDFIAENYELQLRRLARRHEVVAIWTKDEREENVPDSGMLLFQDPESGQEVFVDTHSFVFRDWLKKFGQEHTASTMASLRAGKVELLSIKTSEDYGEAVARFFQARKKRRRK